MPRLPGGQGSQAFGIGLFVPLQPIIYNLPFNQSYWPASQITVHTLYQADFVHTNLALGVPPSGPPISQLDWPLPVSLPFRAAVGPPVFTPLIPTPRNQYDWPTPPTSPVFEISWIHVNFALGGPPVVVQVPFGLDDWPKPQPIPGIPAQSWSSPYVLTTAVVQAPFGLDDWPLPTRPPIVYSPAVQANLQLLTSVKPPNRLDQWPLPSRLPPFAYFEVRSAYLPLLLSLQPPFNLADWPLPIQPPRVYAQSYGTSAVFYVPPPPVPFSLDDWPLPRPAYLVRSDSYSTPSAMVLPPPPAPIPNIATDWAPPIEPYRVYAHQWRPSSNFPLLLSVKPPISQTDWPLPKLIPPFFYAQNYNVPTTITGTPLAIIYQSQWPVPVQPYRVYADVRRADIQLLTSVQPPFNLEDWPQPTQPPKVYAQSYGTPPAVLTPPTPPNSLDDWPLPTQPARVYADVRRADISLLHSNKPPNSQLDWPVPQRSPTPGFTWRNTLTSLQLQRPFNQVDWPLPKEVFTPTSSRTWIQRASLALLQKPFLQADWPQPQRAPVTQHLARVVGIPFNILVVPPVKPFKQDSWPLPTLAQPYIVYSKNQGATAPIIPPFVPPAPPPVGRYRALADLYISDGRYIEANEIFFGPPGWIPAVGVEPLDANAIQAYWDLGPVTMESAERSEALGPWALWDRRKGQITPPAIYWQQVTGQPHLFILTGPGAPLGPKAAP